MGRLAASRYREVRRHGSRYHRVMRRNVLVAVAALSAWACGDAKEPSASGVGGGGVGGSSCVATAGMLSGTAMLTGESPGPGTPADGATITLTPMDGASIQVMADADGRFAGALAAGMWGIAGEHPHQCFTPSPVNVVILACATTQVTVELSECFG